MKETLGIHLEQTVNTWTINCSIFKCTPLMDWQWVISELFSSQHYFLQFTHRKHGSLSQISHLPFQQLICYSNFLLYTNQNCHTFEALLWQLLLNIWIPSSLFSVPFQLLLLPCKGQYEGLTSKSIPYL